MIHSDGVTRQRVLHRLLSVGEMRQLAEIHGRWDQPIRVSRFGDGVRQRLEDAVLDIGYLLDLVEGRG